MTNNNVQNIKFLRNGVVFGPSNDPVKTAREVALDAMEKQKANLADGTAILGRYKETDGVVKTLVGFAYISDDAKTKTLTVFDVDGAGADVDKKIKTAIEALDSNTTSVGGKNVQVNVTEVDGKITAVNITDNTVNSDDVANAITNAINELDGSVVAESGFYVKSVTEADGKISGTTEALPTVSAISAAGKPITAVSENLGAISATAGTINAEFVNIADSGQKFTATTVEDALAEIAAEIDAMDKEASAVDGQVVTTVAEEDGKVTEKKASVKDLQLGGYSKEADATGNIASSDTINTALSKLENKVGANKVSNDDYSIVVTEPTGATTTDIKVNINSDEKVIKLGNDGIYTDIKLSAITVSDTNVKEAWGLFTGTEQLGSTIKIYKDSAYKEIYLGTSADTIDAKNGTITKQKGDKQSLNYAYMKADGTYDLVKVDVSAFLSEEEFKNGLKVEDHVVSVKVDTSSEKVTTGEGVNSDVLTVSTDGVKVNNIQNAIDYAISKLDANVTGGTTAGTKTNGHIQVVVDEVDGKLTAVTVNEANIADADKLADLSGKTVTEAASSNDSITVTPSEAADGTKHLDIITDASKIKMSGFTSTDALSDITESSSVTDALLEVDKVITEKAEVISTALNDLEATKAEKTALDAEIAARKAVDGQSGDTYAANANVNYIGNATSLNDADVKLDAALKAVDDAMLTRVVASNSIIVSDKGNKSQTISVKVKNDDGIVIDETGLHLGTVDCGTY